VEGTNKYIRVAPESDREQLSSDVGRVLETLEQQMRLEKGLKMGLEMPVGDLKQKEKVDIALNELMTVAGQ
jgi:hypothetical protein